jgi:hypothetical protein
VDVSNDDIDDIIVGFANMTQVTILPSNGDGTFGEAVDIAIGHNVGSISHGDPNQDTVPDLVIGPDFSSETITVLLSTP